jgi:hypothetical protein
MTKMKQSDFIGDTATIVVAPKVKNRAERLIEWRKENHKEYLKAQDAQCVCSPTRQQMLLLDQYEGNGPSDL